ncbi:WD40/YVTN repeat-like-containing domain [Ceraceosorus bombacis]|uniref:Ribosome biogenesis protein NSA1 n=1 Tax=Ceraceosorus bombacis TaxID=401625 RepID=A0A0P1BH81_9BASI|nr:WD40/YVTN repeat-like-containing domain [Ceraceosorus bombacis]
MMDADPPLPSTSSGAAQASSSSSGSNANGSSASHTLSPLTSYKFYLCTPTQVLSVRLAALKPTYTSTALKSDAKSKAAQSAAQSQDQAQATASLPKTMKIRNCQGHASPQRAIQRMALGHVRGHKLLALARRDGTIDIVHLSSALRKSDGQEEPKDAESGSSANAGQGQEDLAHADAEEAHVVATIKEDRMRAGMERWLALSYSQRHIYSITSAGSLRRTELLLAPSTAVVQDDFSEREIQSSSDNAIAQGAWSLGESTTLDLPAPLQSATFYPVHEPTHLLMGGEQQALSLWDLKAAFEPTAESDTSLVETERNGNAQESGLSAKERKRKRQAENRAKARELLPGELWRAKPLPNDALSLPQHPRITSVCVLSKSTDGAATLDSDDQPSSAPTQFVAGTRDGLLRFYNTRGGARKAHKEVRVIPSGQGAVRLIVAGSADLGLPNQCADAELKETKGQDAVQTDGRAQIDRHADLTREIFVADQSGKLYAVGVDQGNIRYSYPDINGAITSAMADKMAW